jgi:hypothetical protein
MFLFMGRTQLLQVFKPQILHGGAKYLPLLGLTTLMMKGRPVVSTSKLLE